MDPPPDTALPAIPPSTPRTRVVEDVGTAGKLRHLVKPALALFRQGNDAELPGLGMVRENHEPLVRENLRVLERDRLARPAAEGAGPP